MTKDDNPFGTWRGFGQRYSVDQSVTSHNQTGGITARTVNIGHQTRHLSDDQRKALVGALRGRTGKVWIFFPSFEVGGAQFAEEWAHCFTAAGWEVTITEFHGRLGHEGIRVSVYPDSAAANEVQDALRAAGFAFEAQPDEPAFGLPGYDAGISLGDA